MTMRQTMTLVLAATLTLACGKDGKDGVALPSGTTSTSGGEAMPGKVKLGPAHTPPVTKAAPGDSDRVERVEGYSEVLEDLATRVGQLDTREAYVAFLNKVHDALEPMSAVSLTLLDRYQVWLDKPFRDHPKEVQRLKDAYLGTMKALLSMSGPLSKSLFAQDAEAARVWKKLSALEAKVKRHPLVRELWIRLIRIRDAATKRFFGTSR